MTTEQALIRLYQQAARRLRVQIRAAMNSGQIGTAAYRAQQLRAVETTLRQLGKRARPLAAHASLEAYVLGARIVDVGLEQTGQAAFRFAGAHRHAAEIYAQNLASRLDRARQLVGRRTDDAFRRLALEETGRGVVAGETRREVSRSLQQRLVREGVADSVTGFVDSRGARWQLDDYTEMVARTTTREAMSAATANRMLEIGQELVTISSHADACDICLGYQGKTYALPGRSVDGYPTIDRLPPFHPRCRHVATPAAANLDRLERELGIVA